MIYLPIVGITVTGFAILLLMSKKSHYTSNKTAITLMVLWLIRFLFFFMKVEISDRETLVIIASFDQTLYFLDGVFMFWYVKSLDSSYSFSLKKEVIHLLPFLLLLGISICKAFFFSRAELNQNWKDAIHHIGDDDFVAKFSIVLYIIGMVITNLFYVILSFYKVKKFRSLLRNNVSTLSSTDVHWTYRYLVIWVFLLTIPFVMYFINYLNPLLSIRALQYYIAGSFVLYAILLGFRLTRQKYITIYPYELNRNISKLDNDTCVEDELLFSGLEMLMSQQKPYLNEGLLIKDLADLMELRPNKLSTLINRHASKNFYEYVNYYRVEGVKCDLIESNDQVIQIAYKNGFSSKSTFNEVFKKSTGYTPSLYRKTFKKHQIQ